MQAAIIAGLTLLVLILAAAGGAVLLGFRHSSVSPAAPHHAPSSLPSAPSSPPPPPHYAPSSLPPSPVPTPGPIPPPSPGGGGYTPGWELPKVPDGLDSDLQQLEALFRAAKVPTLKALLTSDIWEVAAAPKGTMDGLCHCTQLYARLGLTEPNGAITLDGLFNALGWATKLTMWGAFWSYLPLQQKAFVLASVLAISGDEGGCWSTCEENCGNEGWADTAAHGYPTDERNAGCGPHYTGLATPIYVEPKYCKNAKIAPGGIFSNALPQMQNCVDPVTKKKIGYQCGTTQVNAKCCYWGRGPLQASGQEVYQAVSEGMSAIGIAGAPDACNEPQVLCSRGGTTWLSVFIYFDKFLWTNWSACSSLKKDLAAMATMDWATITNVEDAVNKKNFWNYKSSASENNICLKLYNVNATWAYGPRYSTYGCAGPHFCQLMNHVFKPLFAKGAVGYDRPRQSSVPPNPAFCCLDPAASTPNICQVCAVPSVSEPHCAPGAWQTPCPSTPGIAGCPFPGGKTSPYGIA
jgi:hypothetical protein